MDTTLNFLYYTINDDGLTTRLEVSNYENEDHLLNFLETNAHSLLGPYISPKNSRDLIIVGKKLKIPTLSSLNLEVDLVILGKDAVVTLIETKLLKKSKAIRDASAQLYEYGDAFFNSVSADSLHRTVSKKILESKLQLRKGMEPVLEVNETIDSYWHRVEENLKLRQIRLILITDSANPDDKKKIKTAAERMGIYETIALSINIMSSNEFERLAKVEHLAYSLAPKESPSRVPLKSEAFDFHKKLDLQFGPDVTNVSWKIFYWMQEHADTYFTTGGKTRQPRLTANFGTKDHPKRPITVHSNGKIVFNIFQIVYDSKKIHRLILINEVLDFLGDLGAVIQQDKKKSIYFLKNNERSPNSIQSMSLDLLCTSAKVEKLLSGLEHFIGLTPLK